MYTLGSLFDGIGGFPLAAMMNGIVPLWASEIEAFPIEVTKARFPDMRHVGDITALRGASLPPVDVIAGGSPCQDLSVAGNRAGLAGERSGLFMEQIRITKELRCADERRGRTADLVRPRFFIWENVPGAFSSGRGEDFRIVLEETCRIADGSVSVPGPPSGAWEPAGAILGEEFSIAWRVLDAQYWGVPQRRKRIFVVADFGGHAAPQILFEQDRLFGHIAPGKRAREGVATPIGNSAENTSGDCLTPWDVQSRRMYPATGRWPALYGGAGGGHGYVATAFACNQRDEVRDLCDVAGALGAQPGMKQQTFVAYGGPNGKRHPAGTQCLTPWDTQQKRIFTGCGVAPTLAGADGGGGRNPGGLVFSAGVVSKGNGDCFITPDIHTSLTSGGGQAGQGFPCVFTAGFSAGASATAGTIGYQAECAPTLKASESGSNMVPSVLCLNDQGGRCMSVTDDVSATLRAEMHHHQPLVLFESHGQDARYNGPLAASPAVSASYGEGGGNIPLAMDGQSFCIAGNIIDREPKNGGNHFGYCPDISYTLNTADRHAVFSRQRVDIFKENDVAATQSARQYKDATDLVLDVAGMDFRNNRENGELSGTLQRGTSLNKIHPVRTGNLIRRLTPLECERLQGFPDGWTEIPGASDTARYKALGNSVAIPCVVFILRGIAYFLRQAA